MALCRSLLAKMCIVREEVDEAASELGMLEIGSPYHSLMSASWRLLPMGPSAFIKELVPVSSPDKRSAWPDLDMASKHGS